MSDAAKRALELATEETDDLLERLDEGHIDPHAAKDLAEAAAIIRQQQTRICQLENACKEHYANVLKQQQEIGRLGARVKALAEYAALLVLEESNE